MGSLHAMYANPEEEDRMQRTRNRLQNDLAEQVMENKTKKLEEEYTKKREELESRQKKLESGLDHWGQPIAAGDPYRIANRMKKEVKDMSDDLQQMKENLRNEMGIDTSPYGNSNNSNNNNNNNNNSNRKNVNSNMNEIYDQNFDALINDELDKFMTPRDVRERMMMAQIPRTDKMDSGEKQNVEERQFQRNTYNNNKKYGKDDGVMLSNADTPSAMSEKSFVGLLSDKLYDMIKGAMWNEAYLRRLFQRFDLDNTGKITATNFRRAFSKLGLAATKSEINEMLKRLDPNRRGTIDYLDFIKICVVNAKTKRANQLLKERKKKRRDKARSVPKGGRGDYGRYRNDQRKQTKRRKNQNTQIAWEERRNAGRTGRYRASSQYKQPTQSDIDAKKIEQLVTLTKRLLKEQSDLRASLARTNEALGV